MKRTLSKNEKAWKAIYSAIPEWKRFKPGLGRKQPIPRGIFYHEAPDLRDFDSHGSNYQPDTP